MIITPQMQTDEYQAALKEFSSGEIVNADRTTLQGHLIAIAQNVTGDDGVQARDTVQALTINHLILQRHIDELERRGSKTQKIIIALTVASLIGTAMQCWLAYRPENSFHNKLQQAKPSASSNVQQNEVAPAISAVNVPPPSSAKELPQNSSGDSVK